MYDPGMEMVEFSLLGRDDVPRLLPLAHEFEAEIGSPFIWVKDEPFVANWRRFIDAGVGLIVGAFDEERKPVGVLSGFVVPNDLNGEPVAQENWWYVTPRYRKGGLGRSLVTLFERYAVQRGARRLSLGSIGHLPAVDGLLRSMGYEPLETHYFKVVA